MFSKNMLGLSKRDEKVDAFNKENNFKRESLLYWNSIMA